MANELKPGGRARVRSGRYKDAHVELVQEDDEQPGFWWVKLADRTGGNLVLREKLIGAGQLEPLQEGGASC